MSWFKNIFKSENKDNNYSEGIFSSTRKSFFNKISKALVGKKYIDSSFLDELEDVLISSDVGIETTISIINSIEARVYKDRYINVSELHNILKDEICKLILDASDFNINELQVPYVIMVVGVNGVGKTTTIAKLANLYKNNGKKVVLGAGDTFRAAAIEQLSYWAKQIDIPIIKGNIGDDPSSIVYKTLEYSKSNDVDIVFIDTAGRLHNKINLMNELSKIKRVMGKIIPFAPQEIMLVLDGATGHNAIEQSKYFMQSTNINSICITKLDGTSKGGVLIGISNKFKIPIKFIGTGEKLNDISYFNKNKYVNSILSFQSD